MGTLAPNGHESGHTVLAVNDTPDQLELLCRLLAQAGYGVVAARDGVEGSVEQTRF
jgi:hypothetical protein